ncbi:uncharacterized protein LOC123441506 [Hordeum vulgare subsp. vulgare]|uniref:uncharacterized protein LOC123441506 n=1 Tax=Hordeum vulgare subsp. vulgare TaxID=112509 RepID=UPI001D1A5480|nr:uncharacterized protein LOC123441506 [Hordeum vulgare subsp. vulgare]
MIAIVSSPVCISLRGELTSFSFRRETPRLVVIYLKYEEEDDDPLDEAVFAQSMTRLTEEETHTIWEKHPPHAAYVGMPFVTLLTRTVVNHHVMKLPKSVCVNCGIEPDEEGIVVLCLTTRDSVTTCANAVHMHGRTIFSAAGWSNLVTSKNL